eukprot:TCALIF_01342-PA protein Name:"Similar to FOXN1 Forkhead box protein N1 (Homo sapiens)" AED:0.09 eAED:0.09 QI:2/1/0.75/1/1/0.75/4/1080/584
MIDTDIKAEFDDVLQGHGIGFATMESLDLITDLDATDSLFQSLTACSTANGTYPTVNSNMGWPHNSINNVSTAPTDSYLSSTAPFNSYLEDMASTVMVNPNNVMPVVTSQNAVMNSAQLGGVMSHAQSLLPPQHQQIQRLSVNTQFSPRSPGSHSPMQQAQYSPQIASPNHGYTVQNQPQTVVQPPQHQQQQPHQAPPTVHIIQKHQGYIDASGKRVIKTVKVLPPSSSPMQQVPSPGIVNHGGLIVSHNGATSSQVMTNGTAHHTSTTPTPVSNNSNRKKNHQLKRQQAEKENGFPKPAYSYSCLIALALKNSPTGSMSVSEIYKFMCEHFPYFKTAPSGWKNSVRHNLSLNKCFEKIEKPAVNGSNQRKGCLWAMNPAKISKMEEEVLKWSRKDPMAIKKGMLLPHTLESLERGEMVKDYNANSTSSASNGATANGRNNPAHNGNMAALGTESEDEDEPRTPTSVSSQGSQGYDSGGSDFVDIEGFSVIPDSSLPELNLQTSGGIFEDLGEERIQFGASNLQQQTQHHVTRIPEGNIYFSPSTEIHGNYSIAPAGSNSVQGAVGGTRTLIMQKQTGQKVFSI